MSPRLTAADLAEWSGGVWSGDPPDGCASVVHDSRAIQPGCLFVAVSGPRFDGHDFVAPALEQGAVASLVERPVDGPHLLVPDVRKALLDLARGYRASFDIPIVGVTGSVGKTTVKELTADLLATLGPTARNPGNWNNDLGLPLSVLAMPRETRFAVFEVGMNHPGELAPLCEVLQPTHAIVTEIGPAHIEHFESVEAIAEEKATLVRSLDSSGVQVLDLDSPWFDFLAERCSGRGIVIDSDIDPLPGPLSVPGAHMHRNALKALAIARHLGVRDEHAATVFRDFSPPGMRWARRVVRGVTFINDAYNANQMSMLAAMEAFAEEACQGRKWVVLGGMGELGHTEDQGHAEVGRCAESGPWTFLAVGELGRKFVAERHVRHATEAAEILRSEAQVGDMVLVKASRSEKLEEVIESFSAEGV